MPFTNKHAGQKLRRLRRRCDLTLRDVERLTKQLAAQRRNSAFIVSTTRLSDFEVHGVTPSIYRLYALSIVYSYDFSKLLNFYDLW